MARDYRTVDLAPGTYPSDNLVAGLSLPPLTQRAAERAQGALLRTLFFAMGPSGTAALLGYRRPHTAQLKLCALDGDSALFDGLVGYATRKAESLGLEVKKELGPIDKSTEAPTCASGRDSYHQTTGFTCGPVATLDALHRKGIVGPITREEEISFWHEATMVVACDPYGLALASKRRDFTPTVYVSKPGCILDPAGSVGILDKELAREKQLFFEKQAHEAHIPVCVGDFDSTDIARILDEGHLAIVLVDEWHWHAERCPHWVTLIEHRGQRFYINDPWCDSAHGETAVDTHALVIDAADLDLVCGYEGAKAMLVF